MLEQDKLERQRQRLAEVSEEEWRVAIEALTRRLLKRLGGFIVGGEHNEKLIKGGKTVFGAHSEAVLGENALYFYESEFLIMMYDGDWEWPEDRSLSEQLEMMVDSVTRHMSEKHDRKGKKAEEPAMLDIDSLGKAEKSIAVSDEPDYRHLLWELLCAAADGDKKLEDYVQTVGESQTLKEVRTRLGMKAGDADRLQKKLKRRVKRTN